MMSEKQLCDLLGKFKFKILSRNHQRYVPLFAHPGSIHQSCKSLTENPTVTLVTLQPPENSGGAVLVFA